MTSKTDDCTTLRQKPQRADKIERPAKPERPALGQRQPQRFAPKRTPRLPAYVRHG